MYTHNPGIEMNTENRATQPMAEFIMNQRTEAQWSVANLLFAWSGLRAAWREEGGFRNHVIGALAMTTTLVVIQPDAIWWAVAFLSSAMLVALELVNSVIERMIDHVDRRLLPEIKLIKDMSAAAVVVASFGVLLLGVAMILDTFAWFG